MSVEDDIIEKLTNSLQPEHLQVINESHMHNVPPGSESHFKIVAVSDLFNGKMLIARHRMVNQALAEELQGPIHALAIYTMTPAEWAESDTTPSSPPCMGGGK
ncbi:MAG: BolA/IbaG family iron-sulfur metabolism protein [Gammaproteobacteria bacterium]|nr:BolA/IbaG family iron-sulfur metabolism protein [Gammaproteobacteria bacterium]